MNHSILFHESSFLSYRKIVSNIKFKVILEVSNGYMIEQPTGNTSLCLHYIQIWHRFYELYR